MIRSARQATRRLLTPLIDGFKIAPVEFILAAFASIWALMVLDEHPFFIEHGPEALTACAMSFVATLSLSALHRFGGIGQAQRLVASVLLCGLFAAMSGVVLDLEIATNIWRVGLLMGALACVIPLTPLAAAGTDESLGVWRFSLNLTTRSIVSLSYGFASFAAVSIAMLCVGELFDVHVEAADYARVAVLIFVAFVPCFVVGGLDTMATESAIADSLSRTMLERAGKWLVAPALVGYLLIIYTYTAKVVSTGEAPENLLSPLALGAAGLGLGAIFFFEPMARSERPDWFSRFVRWLPLGLLAGLPLAGWAIFQRIEQHGWTEFRYFRLVLVAGFALTFLITPLVRRHRESFVLRVGPAVFGLLFVLASIGPFSASKVSRTSQLDHLRGELHEAGLDLRGEVTDEALEDAPAELKRSIASRIGYLRDNHGADTLNHLVGQQDISTVIADLSGYGHAVPSKAPAVAQYAHAERDAPILISRPSEVVGANVYGGGLESNRGWTFALEGQRLELTTGEAFLTADIEPVIADIRAQLEEGRARPTISRDDGVVPLMDKNGEVQGEIFVLSAELRRSSSGWQVTSVDLAAAIYE